DRMGEEWRAGSPLLVAVRLHGIDIGAVEQRLVGVGLIALNPLDQLVLPGHGAASRLRRRPRAGARSAFTQTGSRSSPLWRPFRLVRVGSARARSRIGAI